MKIDVPGDIACDVFEEECRKIVSEYGVQALAANSEWQVCICSSTPQRRSYFFGNSLFYSYYQEMEEERKEDGSHDVVSSLGSIKMLRIEKEVLL